ncbi:MAG: FlgD immunoglobulin-like domain containing protein [Bacteroidota bacterium]|jgi:hypothetical protein
MKTKFTVLSALIALPFSAIMAQTTHYIKIQLDTKKFPNFNCSLNSPADGVTPSPLTEVYMHSGVCWQDPANPSSATAASIYCAQQISPLNSAVWQSVVGNWGANPQADGIGQMVSVGNGVFTKEFIVEQYYSSADVSTAIEPVSGVTSQPMPPNKVAYTMGLVFRDPTGAITGRDSDCKDIFIYQLDSESPKVIKGSDISEWPDGPVSFIYDLAGVETNELFYERNVAPNPLTGDMANINFFVRNHQKDFEINVYDAVGHLVKTIYRGELPAGKQIAHWDATNNQGNKVSNGMYYFSMRSGNNMVTDKIIVNR